MSNETWVFNLNTLAASKLEPPLSSLAVDNEVLYSAKDNDLYTHTGGQDTPVLKTGYIAHDQDRHTTVYTAALSFEGSNPSLSAEYDENGTHVVTDEYEAPLTDRTFKLPRGLRAERIAYRVTNFDTLKNVSIKTNAYPRRR